MILCKLNTFPDIPMQQHFFMIILFLNCGNFQNISWLCTLVSQRTRGLLHGNVTHCYVKPENSKRDYSIIRSIAGKRNNDAVRDLTGS